VVPTQGYVSQPIPAQHGERIAARYLSDATRRRIALGGHTQTDCPCAESYSSGATCPRENFTTNIYRYCRSHAMELCSWLEEYSQTLHQCENR
jgi:hypothetical protein